MTLAVMTPLKVKTAVGTYFVQGAADSSVKQYVTITNTHKFSLKVALTSALVLNEDSRSVSATTTVGSVTGGSYPDTGATSQTLVMPANSTVELEFTHTMDATPEDALSAAMRYQVQTPILSVTITEENSVDITDIGPVEYAMGTILYGPDAEAKMASADDKVRDKAMGRYARLDAEFTAQGGYGAESEAAAIASAYPSPSRL